MANLLIISLNRQKRSKVWKGMNLCVCLLLLFNLSVLGLENNFLQKVSLEMTDVSLEEVFAAIQQQTGYSFVFNTDQIRLKESVTIKVKDTEIKLVLDQLLSKKGYSYIFEGNIIVVSPGNNKQESIKKNVISGKVLDVNGNPIPGVSVLLKGIRLGTSTNVNGEFTMSQPLGVSSSVLVFSFVGMKSKEIKFIGKPITVVLEEDSRVLNDVVVTGYRVVDKRMLTSSIETIKADDLDKIGALTVDEMLEGKVAGLLVTNLSSTPGAAAKIKVRSGGTFTGSRSPLWVVDGVIYEDPVPLTPEEINSFDQVNVIGNALTGINPQDIESINILKDASATAIYGTRAANGVIVVTTKRGKSGTNRVAYSGSVSFVNRPYYSDFNLMNSKERVDVSREIMERNLPYPREIFSYLGFEGALNDYNLGKITYDEFQHRVADAETMNTDWFGELYRPTLTTNHSFNFSGGSDKMRYYYSIGYNYDQGNEKGVGLNRITSRCNLDMNLSSKVLLSVGISGSVQKSDYNHSSINVFDEAFYNSRAVACRNDDGSLFYIDKKLNNSGGYIQSARYNILNEMDNSSRMIKNKDYNLNAQLSWDIVRGIKLRSSLSYRNTTNQSEEWITDQTFMIAGLRTYDTFEDKIDELVNSNAMVPFGGLYSGGVTDQSSFMGQAQLNFSKVIQKHVFNLNLGGEVNSINYEGSNGWEAPGYNHEQGRSFIKIPRFTIDPSDYQMIDFDYTHTVNWLVGDAGRDIYPTIIDRTSNTVSMFMIFNYSFDNRYIFNFNMRSDGSNQFGQYERYKFRPAWSVSGRWNIHEESFISKNVLEELAMRASYGFRGNPPVGTPYMVITNYQFDPDYKEDLANLSSLPNSGLTWEVTSTLNLGLNYSLWNGRLSGAFDFSYSNSKDLLLNRPVSLVNGKGSQQYNGGKKKDYSYELSLRGVLIKKKDFGWSISGNLTHLKEKILAGYELDGRTLRAADYLNGSIYLTGFPVDAFYSYQFAGLDKDGLPTFKNLDSKKESVFGYFSDVLKYSGQRTPKVYGGFSTEVKVKDFTVRANFSYKLGHHTRMLPLYNGSQNMPMPYENMSSEFVNRWRKPGDEGHTNIPALSAEGLKINTISNVHLKYKEVVPSGKTGWYMYDMSDERVVNASHIRFQSVTLSYMLPPKALKAIKCSSMQVSFQAANLGTLNFDKKLKGQDPEQIKSIGIPSLPTYSLSINLGI
ncbi:MAG: SusC/RagA family TonB-linked outer membrane protein [Odoribacter sp.]